MVKKCYGQYGVKKEVKEVMSQQEILRIVMTDWRFHNRYYLPCSLSITIDYARVSITVNCASLSITEELEPK